jgi:uncharacterized membrane protein YuzA (DUF378 family)
MEFVRGVVFSGKHFLLQGDSIVKSAYWLAMILVIIGAVNWGLVGLFQFDLVAALFGPASALSRLVYALVGVAGVALAVIAATIQSSLRHAHATLTSR